MSPRFAFAPLALLAGAITPSAFAQAPAPPADVYVAVRTTLGTITLDLDAAHAPVTTGNFLRYVDQRRFDGTVFYRAMHLAWGDQPNGLIQGGTRNDPRRVLKPIAHEPTSTSGVRHTAGAISMARFAPGSATGDFSILLSAMPGLDADPNAADADARAGFAAFGHVVAGMDVVRAIWDLPRSPTQGVGVMKGQMLAAPVTIVSVRRARAPAPPPAPAATSPRTSPPGGP